MSEKREFTANARVRVTATSTSLKTRMVMNLYRIYNGFTGFDAVHALACAQTEQEAIELARPMFAKEQPSNPHYSEHLTAELVLTDVSRAQCSEVV